MSHLRKRPRPKKQRRLCRADYEPMFEEALTENPDWLVGAY